MTDIKLPPKLPRILTRDILGAEVPSVPNLTDTRHYRVRDVVKAPDAHQRNRAPAYEIPQGQTPQEFVDEQIVENSAPDSQKYVYYEVTAFHASHMGPEVLNIWLHEAAEAMGANNIYFQVRPGFRAPSAPHTKGKLREFGEIISANLGPSYAICAFVRWRKRPEPSRHGKVWKAP